MEAKKSLHGMEALPDYCVYTMEMREKVFYTVIAAAAVFAIGFMFYRSVILSAVLCPLALLYPGVKAREKMEKRRKELNIQFRDMLYSLSSSLSAGRPVERAFKEVRRDLAIQYPDPDTDILRETEYILRKLELNEPVESALADLALRSGVEDIESFADVFSACKRTGGNLVEVIRNSSNMIGDKVEVAQEIDLMLAQRRMEQKVLGIIPILLILLLQINAWDYILPVYTTAAGRVVMSISMVLIVLAFCISRKLADIRV